MADSRFSWMDEEDDRAESNQLKGQTENVDAPRMKKVIRTPKRTTRGIFVDDSIWEDFEDIIYQQKKQKGKSKPELAEEALLYIIEKYKK
ncbi:hypothetical protein MW344_003872 [Vibrio parahaemolyticus]|uniref:hypothetical protein n=1 Tax=Vibrio parahaemolyticus TaxID=670 RepID=UPI001780CD41|nr:hypothetical protein [Vibrio parahaemolyticus]EGQ8551619.1 hypothetical protein [Vibrio parahaemolyticus]EGQ9074393.1 hypothetical protein [Vibrio parahaemolyticus]EGQ9133087.1 hypothetical protein [Vibrio parahaemolyticus]EIO3217307.1 hypothetical protein [Vibrio parahaemolyticus]EJB8439276.1 hypothetical protein [Vibrio parahaemolyticus]